MKDVEVKSLLLQLDFEKKLTQKLRGKLNNLNHAFVAGERNEEGILDQQTKKKESSRQVVNQLRQEIEKQKQMIEDFHKNNEDALLELSGKIDKLLQANERPRASGKRNRGRKRGRK